MTSPDSSTTTTPKGRPSAVAVVRNIVVGVILSLVIYGGIVLWRHEKRIVHRGSVALTGHSGERLKDHPSFLAVVDNYVYIHNAFRNDLAEIIKMMTTAATHGSSKHEKFVAAFHEWSDTLRMHSQVEDEVLIPSLMARMKDSKGTDPTNKYHVPNSLTSGKAHLAVEKLIAKVEEASAGNETGWEIPVTGALQNLQDAFHDHLQQEELHVMPLMLELFTTRELWALDSFIVNPNLHYCNSSEVLLRITLWWFGNIGLSEGWVLFQNFIRAGNQPEMSLEDWKRLQRDIPALRETPVENLIS